jgi:hypothetical protein
MLTLKNIDVEKSLSRKRLIYSKEFMEYLDLIIYPFAQIFAFVICPYLIFFYELDFENVNERFIGYYILPLVTFNGIYMTIRMFTQLRLKKIETNNTCIQNHQLILEFAKNEEFVVRRKKRNEEDCIIMDKPIMESKYGRTAVLQLNNEEIYFTFVQDGFKLNTPTFIYHILFARRLKKWLSINTCKTPLESD